MLNMKSIMVAIVFMLAGLITTAQVKVEQMAPEISLPDAKDNAINLSSLKGKVVLIDFWASWCGPCRAAIPNVIKLYDKYKANGFEVFGVSIDSKKTDWLKAIVNDKIKYTQVMDKDGWNSAVAEKYGVYSIPSTFLLDKTGKVVAVDLDGEELEKKVKDLL